MTVSSVEPRVAQCRAICVPLCGTKQYATPCHGQKCINCRLFWASLYCVYHFLFIPTPPHPFLSIHANFSVAATSTQISLYSISVSSLFILLFLPSFSSFFLSLEFCQPRVMKREENREICCWCNVPVCISLLRLLISVGLSGFCVIDSSSFPNRCLGFLTAPTDFEPGQRQLRTLTADRFSGYW